MVLVAFDTSVLDAKIAHLDAAIERHDAEILSPPWLDNVLAAVGKVASIELRLSQMEEDIDTINHCLVMLGASRTRAEPGAEGATAAAADGADGAVSNENAGAWEILSAQLSTLRKQMKQLQRTHNIEDVITQVDKKLGDFSVKFDRTVANLEDSVSQSDLQQLSQRMSQDVAEAKNHVLEQCSQHMDDREAKMQERIIALEETAENQTAEMSKQVSLLAALERHEAAITGLQSQQATLVHAGEQTTTLCSNLKLSNIYRAVDKLTSRLERRSNRQLVTSFSLWRRMVHGGSVEAMPSRGFVRREKASSSFGNAGGAGVWMQAQLMQVGVGVRILSRCVKRAPFLHWRRKGRIPALLRRIIQRKGVAELALVEDAFVRLQCPMFDSLSLGRSQCFTNSLLRMVNSANSGRYLHHQSHLARLTAAFLVGARRAIEKLQQTDLATITDMDARLKAQTHSIMLVVEQNRGDGMQTVQEMSRVIRAELTMLSTQVDERFSDMDSRHTQLTSNLEDTTHSLARTSASLHDTSSELSRQMALIGKLGLRLDGHHARLDELGARADKDEQRISSTEASMRDLVMQLDDSNAKQEEQWKAVGETWRQMRVNVVGVVETQERNDEQLESLQLAMTSLQAMTHSSNSSLNARIDNIGLEMPDLSIVVEAAMYFESQALLTSRVERMSEDMSDQMGRWALRAASYIATTADLYTVANIAQGADEDLDPDKAVQKRREELFKELDRLLYRAVEVAHPNPGTVRADARARFRSYVLEAVDAALSKHEQLYVTGSTRMSNMLTSNPKCLACDRPLRIRVRAEGAQYLSAMLPSDGTTPIAPMDASRPKERPQTAPTKRARSRPSSARPISHSQSVLPALLPTPQPGGATNGTADDFEVDVVPIETRRLAATRSASITASIPTSAP